MLQLTDEQFELLDSDQCDLLIHLGSGNIAYAVIDSQKQLKILSNQPVPENEKSSSLIPWLDDLLKSSVLLQQKFRRVKISLETEAFTFIPQELYSEDLLDDYAQFIKPKAGSELRTSTIQSAGINHIAAINSELIEGLNARFNQPLIISSILPFMESTLQIIRKSHSTHLFLNFYEDAFEAAYYERGQFIFYNKFEFSTEDEFNYFLLQVIEQLEIDLLKTSLQVSGKIEQDDEHMSRLGKYFNEISFAVVTNLVEVPSSIASKTLLHPYFSLISLGLCE